MTTRGRDPGPPGRSGGGDRPRRPGGDRPGPPGRPGRRPGDGRRAGDHPPRRPRPGRDEATGRSASPTDGRQGTRGESPRRSEGLPRKSPPRFRPPRDDYGPPPATLRRPAPPRRPPRPPRPPRRITIRRGEPGKRIGIALVAVAVVEARRAGQLYVPTRIVVFLVATLAVGPGLVTNTILKSYWSRPRPSEVVQFGGTDSFVPWWDPRGTCEKNCSFISGEVSGATWTLAPAVLVPGAAGVAAIAAAAMFIVTLAAQRIMSGGHFFTDAAFALLTTGFIIWLFYGLCFRWTAHARSCARSETISDRPGGGF